MPTKFIKYLLLLYFAGSFQQVLPATDTLLYHHTLNWSNELAVYPQLPFDGSGFWEDSTGLPVYRATFPLPEEFNHQNFNSNITLREWAPFPGTISDMRPDDLQRPPVFRITHVKKQPFLEVELIPFSHSENSSQPWNKLTNINLSITFTKISEDNLARLKNERLKYAASSRLASGLWVKLATSEPGIQKIPWSKLSSRGFSDPSKVQVYGYGGSMVPPANSTPRPDDLPPVPVWHYNNALYFYSPGIHRWEWNQIEKKYEHESHKFSPRAIFFISQAAGALSKIDQATEVTAEANLQVNTYDYLHLHEKELENILHSGSTWFGEKFNNTIGLEKTFTVEVPQLITDSMALLSTSVLGRSNSGHGFTISANGTTIENLNINTVSLSNYTGYYAHATEGTTHFKPQPNPIELSFRYTNPQTTSIGWLDYFVLQAKARLKLEESQLIFRNHNTAGAENISNFTVDAQGNNLQIWEITDPTKTFNIPLTQMGNKISFKDSTKTLKTYVVFNPDSDFTEPEMTETVPNQNLHSTSPAEMVIVAPAEFLDQANRLAEMHRKHSGLVSVIVNREQLYNEFSWGHPDPGAIRGFLKMLYDRAGDESALAPKLLLLFGDGSFDNRHIAQPLPAPLPTYQSENSIYQTSTYVTDDYFGLLDDSEGDDLRNDRLDIGIGRLPANKPEEAIKAVNKIENYLYHQSGGKWKTRLTFVGDDGDYNIHMRDAEKLTNQVYETQPWFDFNKIYLDAYKATMASTGKEFPGARTDIERAISEGTLLFNYTGHGSENGLAHERVIGRSDINAWNNLDKLPLFVTATCEFSRFDDHNLTSAGEEVLLSPIGGAFALLSTTRIVYSSLNYTLNKAFNDHVFGLDADGLPLRLGEITRRTKLESGSSINKLSFTLLGDPALRLKMPVNTVITKTINDHPAADSDTLKALSVNTLKGAITSPAGKEMSNFNGEVNIVVYDKAVETQTLGNNGSEPFEYTEFANILFKGTATVTNGQFSTTFAVPRDIRYNFGRGRISYYAVSETGIEASGAFNEVMVGGIAGNSGSDSQGPDLQMYLNHPRFKTGDLTGRRPMLYARVFDESGINTAGIGIGHNITLVIDENTQNPLILNDAFTFLPDSYQDGMIAYHLPEMQEGTHELTLKIWDTHNNSSSASLSFKVSTAGDLKLRDFSVFPNPVSDKSQVYATLRTDEPNSAFTATIDFINTTGRVIGSHQQELIANGNLIGPFRLPLEKSGWKRQELCFVRVTLTGRSGRKAMAVEKLLPAP